MIKEIRSGGRPPEVDEDAEVEENPKVKSDFKVEELE